MTGIVIFTEQTAARLRLAGLPCVESHAEPQRARHLRPVSVIFDLGSQVLDLDENGRPLQDPGAVGWTHSPARRGVADGTSLPVSAFAARTSWVEWPPIVDSPAGAPHVTAVRDWRGY